MAFNVRGRWSMDNASLDKALKKGRDSIKKWSKDTAASIGKTFAAAFAIGAIKNTATGLVNFGSKVVDLAGQLQLSTQEVQKFMFAAEQTGTSVEAVAVGLAQLARTQRDAIQGSEKLRNSYALLGVSMDTLTRGDRVQVLKEIEKTLQTTKLNTEQLAAASDVLGESARQLFPAMRAGFPDMLDDLQEINGLMGEDTVRSLKAIGDEWTNLKFKVRAFLADFAPFLALASKMIDATVAFRHAVSMPAGYIGGLIGSRGDMSVATEAAFSPLRNEIQHTFPALRPYEATGNVSQVRTFGELAIELEAMREALGDQTMELKDINRNTKEGGLF